MTLSE
ncbi:Protein of unknown function [Escherichia coli D6-117.29]